MEYENWDFSMESEMKLSAQNFKIRWTYFIIFNKNYGNNPVVSEDQWFPFMVGGGGIENF